MKALIAVPILALAVAGCGGSSYSSNASSGSSSTTAKAASTSSGGGSSAYGGYGGGSSKKSSSSTAAASASGGALTVQMHDNFFGTKTITGTPGSTVKVTLQNVGQHQHNFSIASQKGVNADVAPGKTATVSVRIPKSGSAQFYCEYHRGLGMTGTVKGT